jgi:putative membrane protein insertion efficiency factor
MQTIILYFIKVYRLLLSPFLGQACRFEPSCSRYAEEAIKTHGTLKGSALGVKRICRCHPWNEGGFDPVPAHNEQS